MSLIDELYRQPDLIAELKQQGLIHDKSLLIPWHSNQAVLTNPETGAIDTFIFANPMGGVTVADGSTNTMGFTTEDAYGAHLFSETGEPLAVLAHDSPTEDLFRFNETIYASSPGASPLPIPDFEIDSLDALNVQFDSSFSAGEWELADPDQLFAFFDLLF
ncbi:hypothetical protein [Cohnella hongkongensis]|uniref:Uncharacterized protein n=1 Tax=Cohnella hongkongensis TaxID=178337 RepID=A0ABV9FMG5_9BACL